MTGLCLSSGLKTTSHSAITWHVVVKIWMYIAGEPTSADVNPIDVIAYIGDDVTISCTLRDPSASDPGWLYFRHLSQGQVYEVPEAAQHVVPPDTLQMKLRNVSTAQAGYYFCFVDPSGERNGVPATVVSSLVKVGVTPPPVQDISCLMRNMDTINCTWCSGPMEPWIDYTLTWIVPTSSPEEKRCQTYGQNRCSCEISGADVSTSSLYIFTVTGRNDFGTSEAEFDIAAEEMMVAGPVENLEATSIGDNWICLYWNPPQGLMTNLSYDITYTNQNNLLQASVFVTNTSRLLDDLEPNTLYLVSVRASIPSSPYEGEAREIFCRTAGVGSGSGYDLN